MVLPTSITSFITAVDKALSPGSPGDCAERQVVDARVAGDEDAEAVAAASHVEVRPCLAVDDRADRRKGKTLRICKAIWIVGLLHLQEHY